MDIVLLEDDLQQVTEIEDDLRRAIGPIYNLAAFSSESEFRAAIDSGRFDANAPRLFILDLMVRWAVPQKIIPPPPADVKAEGYYTAGLRCIRLLRGRGISSPIIAYSVLTREDLETYPEVAAAGIELVTKDPESNAFAAAIRRALTNRG